MATDAGRAAPPITAFVLASVADDDQAAREAVRDAVGFFLKAEAHTALVGQSRYGSEIRRRVAALEEDEPLAVEDAWIDEFAAAGSPGQVRGRLRGCSTPVPTRSACGCSRPTASRTSCSGWPSTSWAGPLRDRARRGLHAQVPGGGPAARRARARKTCR
ncbi:LLM class flavin-dependent oxidoreductase [Nonomuraea recticatena]|uniref:LLM class flavin-dependent oxidoreductase n=1 Tax=Nonomuraea recticatena TaxID=46178 RepID=UPI003621B725